MGFVHQVLLILKALYIVLSENHHYFEKFAPKKIGMPPRMLP